LLSPLFLSTAHSPFLLPPFCVLSSVPFIGIPSCCLSFLDKDRILRLCVLGELGHRQSRHRWTVGDGFLGVVGASGRRRTRRWTEKLVMEVVGIAMCLVVWSACVFCLFLQGAFTSVFQRRKTVNRNEKRRRFWTGAAVIQSNPPCFNVS
jgi:hypothetical protein